MADKTIIANEEGNVAGGACEQPFVGIMDEEKEDEEDREGPNNNISPKRLKLSNDDVANANSWYSNGKRKQSYESYSTPLDIEPCSRQRIRDHITRLKTEVEAHRELMNKKLAEIEYAEGRSRYLRLEKVKICSVGGCTNQVKKHGLCGRHAPEREYCSIEDCNNLATKDMLCNKHRSDFKPTKRSVCLHEGCTMQRQWRGYCHRHGGARPVPNCIVEGCSNQGRRKGQLCDTHAGVPIKYCSYEGCTNRATRVNPNLCDSHRPDHVRKKIICNYEGCTNERKTRGGFCRKHRDCYYDRERVEEEKQHHEDGDGGGEGNDCEW